MKILEPKKGELQMISSVDDLFKFVLVPDAMDEYEDDDEDFVDDEEED